MPEELQPYFDQLNASRQNLEAAELAAAQAKLQVQAHAKAAVDAMNQFYGLKAE